MSQSASAKMQDGHNGSGKCTPLRVLHVCYAPTIGGTETLCLQLVKHSDPTRWSPEVVFLTEEHGPIRQELEASGIAVHVCPFQSGRLAFVRAFAALCRRRSAYAVHCHSFGPHFFVAVGAWLGGVRRMLAAVQNPAPGGLTARFKTALQAQLARPFVTWDVACSHYVADSVVRSYCLPKRNVAVVWNWCDVQAIGARAAAARAPVRSGSPVIGMISRMDPIKDQGTLLRSFALFRQHYPDARLRLVGDGETRERLERMTSELGIAESVSFVGARRDVPEQLALLDIFVFSTTQDEGFGIVLAEAMAAGVPIVASDVGPCSEVLNGGEAGILVRPRDHLALADALERLWRDPVLRDRVAAAGRRLARERYSVDRAQEALWKMISGADSF